MIPGFFQNWLESLCLIWLLDVHLSIYVKLDRASLSSWFLCSLLMYNCMLCITPRVGTGWDPIEPIWCCMDCMYFGSIGKFV